MSVRLATSADVNELISLVREAHAEEGSPVLSFDEEAVFSVILQALSGSAIIGVIGEPGYLQSACFIQLAKPWYSVNPLIDSALAYTHPDYRKSDNTKKLLLWMRLQSKRLGCPLQIDVPITEDNQPKLSLCERILGKPGGISFTYKPNPEEPTEPPTPVVEPASLADETEIRTIAKEIANEIAVFQLDEPMTYQVLRNALEGNGVIGVVREPAGRIGATIFLDISRPWFSSSEYVNERFAFVRPEYRKSNDARALLHFAKRQADRLNIPLRIGVGAKDEISRKLQLYRRVFGAPSNAHFLFNPNTVN